MNINKIKKKNGLGDKIEKNIKPLENTIESAEAWKNKFKVQCDTNSRDCVKTKR
jgi:hypothetical protein